MKKSGLWDRGVVTGGPGQKHDWKKMTWSVRQWYGHLRVKNDKVYPHAFNFQCSSLLHCSRPWSCHLNNLFWFLNKLCECLDNVSECLDNVSECLDNLPRCLRSLRTCEHILWLAFLTICLVLSKYKFFNPEISSYNVTQTSADTSIWHFLASFLHRATKMQVLK